jgi:predicted HTH domain antitoxin
MQSFTIRDLRERPGELSREAEQGNLTLITRHGHPLFVGVPFDDAMLRHGVNTALAENLFKSGALSLGKAAALAHMSIAEFAEYLSQLGIPVVDYPAAELDDELNVFEQQ